MTLYIEKNTDLVERCKRGERKAQFEIYRLYSKAMFNICMRILNHEGEAEDVLQEAFIDAFLKIGDFRQQASFGVWLKQIVVNKAINQLRSRKVQWLDIENFKAEDGDYNIADSVDNDDDNDKNFEVEKIRNALEQLPEGYRVVLSLYLFEGYDHEEISQILHISESTSRTQYMRAKQKLMQIMNNRMID